MRAKGEYFGNGSEPDCHIQCGQAANLLVTPSLC
jgi:hypothetical protein